MATKHVTFDDELYIELVKLNRSMKHRDFSETVNYLVREGLEALRAKR
ncbi:MAG: hypothetical protein HA494_09370 [Thaumarchaeota archaeon]|nr:hypothetical protein [Nitrososphaerota archaeon]